MPSQDKMKSRQPIIDNFPIGFQEKAIDLISNVIRVSELRFWLYKPKLDIEGCVFYNEVKEIESIYDEKYSKIDPMHPARYEGTDISVICSDTLMVGDEWRKSVFYREFMAPRNYDHDVDIFFRNNGKIIAVLYILRDDRIGPFNEADLSLLRRLQPFMEYTLNKVYIPQRISERENLVDKFSLTKRELDVMEMAMTGVDTKTLAKELNLEVSTVKTHLRHIFEKVGIRSVNELISIMFRESSH